LEAEREKELAEVKAKQEWDKAIAEDKEAKAEKLRDSIRFQGMTQKSADNYSIETSKLEFDDSMLPKGDSRISFS
jgi:hypothetical protein